MGQLEIFKSKYFQIFIAILIPNLGSWIIGFILRDKFAQEREPIKSFLDPPGWVRIYIIRFRIFSSKFTINSRSLELPGHFCSQQWATQVGGYFIMEKMDGQKFHLSST